MFLYSCLLRLLVFVSWFRCGLFTKYGKGIRCFISKNTSISTPYMIDLNWSINKFSAYPCGHYNMIQFQLECEGHDGVKSIFESITFLYSLRNKQLGIIGDSVTLHLYQALRNQLFDFQTKEIEGNGTFYRNLYKHSFESAFTKYDQYNATIFWCRVPTLLIDTSAKKENRDYCSDLLIRTSDYLVVGVAAWFKPFYSQDISDGTNFSHNSELSSQQFQNRITTSRAYIKLKNPLLKVIWRLQPHAGRIDELLYLQNITENHKDGWLWSNETCASWVTRYNHMTVAVANRYGDKIMDWYTLSNKYLEYFSAFNRSDQLQVHADSMHYCAQGFPRGAMLLLQMAINEIRAGQGGTIAGIDEPKTQTTTGALSYTKKSFERLQSSSQPSNPHKDKSNLVSYTKRYITPDPHRTSFSRTARKAPRRSSS